MSDNDVKIKVSLDGDKVVIAGLQGIGDATSETDSKMGKLVSGGLAGAGKALVGFAGAAAAAGGALAASVVSSYAAAQQSVGGIETLFKGSADTLKGYAANAYQTAGLSANAYMEQVTSFSASLIQGLGGDTAKAAELSNVAMISMSDNANKFGTNIGDIQNAYQGFAKQNFTMLDNLKLGYGGTQEEMQRLLDHASQLPGAMGQKFDLNNFADVVQAIQLVQEEMGVAGTTAKEASSTISGSVGQMKGAWDNLLVSLGAAGDDSLAFLDLQKQAEAVVSSLGTVIGNVTPVIESLGQSFVTLGPQIGTMIQGLVGAVAEAIPAILNAGVAIVNGLLAGIASALPGLITALIPGIVGLVNSLSGMLPLLMDAGLQAVGAMVMGLAQAAPTIITSLTEAVTGMAQALINNLPQLLNAGLQLMLGLAQGVMQAIPILIEAIPPLLEGWMQFLTDGIPLIMEAGMQLFMGLLEALPTVITALVEALPQIIDTFITWITSSIPMILEAGIQLFMALVQALPQVVMLLVEALPTLINGIITGLLTAIPQLIQAGIQLFISLIQALPQIITTIVQAIPQIITGIVTALLNAIPQLIQAGIQLLISLIQALPQIITTIVAAIPQIIGGILGALAGSIPQIVSMGVTLIGSLINNIGSAIGMIVGAIPQVISGIVNALGAGVGAVAEVGANLVRGIWDGISGAAGWLMDQIGGFANDVMSNIGSFFGIHSPSTRMRDEIGQFLPPGIGLGVAQNKDKAIQPIRDLGSDIMAELDSLDVQTSLAANAAIQQTMVPLRATATPNAPLSVEASIDTASLGAVISNAFSQDSPDQVPVTLSRESVRELSTAIVDAIRVQSRQGVTVLG